MGTSLAWRAAILLAGAGTRMVRWAEGPGVDTGLSLSQELWGRLSDPGESDEDLSAALSDRVGTMATVETITGSFELRKAQVKFGRTSGAAGGTDDAICTFHAVKLVSGSPSSTWAEADFLAWEARFLTFWNAIKSQYFVETSYKQLRWYKAGPDIEQSGPPVRVIDPAVAGTVASGRPCPPQVAISVTEKTTDAKSWGRFYLPHPAGEVVSWPNARYVTANQTALADAADAMYEGCLTDNVPIVVYSKAKPARTTAAGTTLPAIGARALPVKQIQIDDLFDVIRSRRWNEPLLRVQRDVAGS